MVLRLHFFQVDKRNVKRSSAFLCQRLERLQFARNSERRLIMRSFLCSLVLGLATLGTVAVTPGDASARPWRGGGYGYSSYYYPGYSSYYYTPGYSSYYYTPSYSSYYYDSDDYYYPSDSSSYYYSPGYSSYYYTPSTSYYTPGYRSYYYGRGRWR